jgi:hypothetical protein
MREEQKGAYRDPAHYMGRGTNPMAGVTDSRLQREATTFFNDPKNTAAGLPPNNPLNFRSASIEQGRQEGQVISNLYGDWRREGLYDRSRPLAQLTPPSSAARFLQAPTPDGMNAEIASVPMGANGTLGRGTGPLEIQPPPIATDPGLSATVARSSNGTPIGRPLGPGSTDVLQYLEGKRPKGLPPGFMPSGARLLA